MAKPSSIDPGDWPEPSGRPRILVESPDRADLWAHAETLREAGFDVAVCAGPIDPTASNEKSATTCPLLSDGRCSLAEGADVLVTSADLLDAEELVRARARSGSVVVIESTHAATTRLGDARRVTQSSSGRLLEAVDRGAAPLARPQVASRPMPPRYRRPSEKLLDAVRTDQAN